MPTKAQKNHRELLALVKGTQGSLDRFYAQQTRALASALKGFKLKSKTNVWAGNKAIEAKVNKVLGNMDKGFQGFVKRQMEAAIALNNGHIDDVVAAYTKGVQIKQSQALNYAHRNRAAMNGWMSRRLDGLSLSNRVWRLDKQTKAQMEGYLREGLADGTAATKMATDLKQYLRNPDKRFRRVRDPETGKLKLSKPAQGYHPGRGVYRSSYANALRVARNEVNLAYRQNDYLRVQNLDFIKGIRVNLSPAHPEYDICDEMEGPYPKKFQFSGWHPNCLCYTTTILESKKDFIDRQNGKPNNGGQVKRIPKRAQRYLDQNSEQIKGWSNQPYFLENFKNVKDGFEIKSDIGKPAIIKQPLSGRYGREEDLKRNIALGQDAHMDTNEMYRDDNGNLLPARQQMRDRAIKKWADRGDKGPSTNTVHILGGAPANGKSTFEKSKHFTKVKNSGTLTINPDELKESVPEYNYLLKRGDTQAANFAHEESSSLGKAVIRETLSRKNDFIMDGVNGGPVSKVATKFQGYRDGGRNKLIGNYMTLDNSLAQKLMIARGKKTGRYIHQGYFKQMQTTMPDTVEGIIKNNLLDEFYLWDTNINGTPRLILKQIGGKVTMYDEKLWQRFLRKRTDTSAFPD